jgi:hypothetical protein
MSRLADWSAIVAIHAAAAVPAAAFAQAGASTNYTSFDATSAKPVQIGYYGSAHKDCTAATPPTIRVVEAPRSGLFTVRRGVLTTNNLPNCPGLKVPAEVAFYQARPGVTGTDHIVYLVTSSEGSVAAYDVSINIKETPKPAAPGPANPI